MNCRMILIRDHLRLMVRWALAVPATALAVSLVWQVSSQAEDPAESPPADAVWQEGFEGPRPTWIREEVDAPVDWLTHDRSELAAREGSKSERFVFNSGPGSGIYASLAVPRIKVREDLNVSLNLKSDRSGMSLLARIVFPEDKDPDTGKPSFVVIAGGAYTNTGVWQKLALIDISNEMERQARLLRIRSQRKVSTGGAYLERIILNLYGGAGQTTIFVDDLRISPVESSLVADRAEQAAAGAEKLVGAEDAAIRNQDQSKLGSKRVIMQGGQLRRDGIGWIFSMIDAPGTKSDQLLRVGFDVLSVDSAVNRESLLEMAQMGFMVAPRVSGGRLIADDDPDRAFERAKKFPIQESVAFWDLGRNLGVTLDNPSGEKQLERNRALVRKIHEEATQAETAGRTFSNLVSGIAGGRLAGYAMPQNHLEIMGIDPTVWSPGKTHQDVFSFLQQRRDLTTLANPGGVLFWGWVAARSEPSVTRQLWGEDMPPAWGYPRRLPEQIRLDAYCLIASGYRGWGVKGDADLTRESGRSMLLELGFLNEELDLVESFLSDQQGQIQAIECHPPDPPVRLSKNGISSLNTKMVVSNETVKHPSIKGVAINLPEKRGRLLLMADLEDAAQWQPPQMSINNLTVRVPGTAENATPFLISPGEVRVLERKRVPGGLQVIIPEFDTTAMVLLTTDEAMGQWLSVAVARNRAMACSMAIEQADRQIAWVTETHNRLANDGFTVNDAAIWLAGAQERVQSARESQAREDFAQAWIEARRALRPLRILMRDHWNSALKTLEDSATSNLKSAVPAESVGEPAPAELPILVSPVSSPGLLSFNTLPQHYLWASWIRDGRFSGDGVKGGNFDRPEALRDGGWVNLSRDLDGRQGAALSADDSKGQGRVLRLNVSKKADARIDELSAFVDHPVAAVRTHPIKVSPREMIRIRVKVRMPRPQQPGAGGLVVEDSLGGPSLAFRRTKAIPEWSEIVLYRRAVSETSMTVTLGLAGDGDLFFDDLRVERLTENAPLNKDRVAIRDGQPTTGGVPEPGVPVAAPAESVVPDNRP
ncbi:MAG: hypothetical protein WCJ40_11540 [Planctomycetota bacterium]